MNGWIFFQLLVDLFLVILVLAFIFRESKKNPPNADEFRQLVEDFQFAVEKSEKVARELDRQLKARRDSLANLGAVDTVEKKPEPVAPVLAEKAEPKPVAEKPERDIVEKTVGNHKQQVMELYRQGLPTDEISNRLSISLPAVKLIVAMLDSSEPA